MSSLTLSARLEKAKVAANKSHKLHLLVNLEGKKIEGKRKPLCLGVAIDLSTSMQGQKVEDAKNGLEKLVDHLTGEDTLTIVAFSTTVWTALEPTRMTQDVKDRVKGEIRAMYVHSSTNLSGATVATYDQVRKAAEKRLKESVSRALLFTDGCPTAGDCSQPGLVAIAKGRPEDTNLICFGYGEDYNAELMTQMAKAGGGDAYHIKTPDEFGPTLGRVLGGLLTCVAQNVKVTLKTKPDVKILEVLNDFDVTANDKKTEATITVDDVYSEEKRRVLVEIEIPEMDQSVRQFTLGTVAIEYQDLVTQEKRSEEVSFKVQYVKEIEADKEADKEVAEQIAVLKASKAQDEAMRLAKMGRFGEAKSVIRGAAQDLQDVGTVFSCSMADDLNDNVQTLLSKEKFAMGGAHYLHSNADSYRHGRGQTLGASKLFGTEAQAKMEASFTKPGAGASVPQGAVPAVPPFMGTPLNPNVYGPGSSPGQLGFPPMTGGVAGTNPPLNVPVTEPEKPLSKKRTRRQ